MEGRAKEPLYYRKLNRQVNFDLLYVITTSPDQDADIGIRGRLVLLNGVSECGFVVTQRCQFTLLYRECLLPPSYLQERTKANHSL